MYVCKKNSWCEYLNCGCPRFRGHALLSFLHILAHEVDCISKHKSQNMSKNIQQLFMLEIKFLD